MGLPSPPRRLLMSAALAPPAPTSPARGAPQLGADSPAPARWPQTRGHARRSGIRTRGRARARKAPASARPSQPRAEVGGTRGPSPAEAERPRRRRLPFSHPASPWSASATGPKKRRKSCLPPGSPAVRAFVWKVSISGSGCSVCSVTFALDRPAGKGGGGESPG